MFPDSRWYWSAGSEATYFKWAPDEPNNDDGTENCVEMLMKGRPELWNDHFCSDSLSFVSQVEKGM